MLGALKRGLSSVVRGMGFGAKSTSLSGVKTFSDALRAVPMAKTTMGLAALPAGYIGSKLIAGEGSFFGLESLKTKAQRTSRARYGEEANTSGFDLLGTAAFLGGGAIAGVAAFRALRPGLRGATGAQRNALQQAKANNLPAILRGETSSYASKEMAYSIERIGAKMEVPVFGGRAPIAGDAVTIPMRRLRGGLARARGAAASTSLRKGTESMRPPGNFLLTKAMQYPAKLAYKHPYFTTAMFAGGAASVLGKGSTPPYQGTTVPVTPMRAANAALKRSTQAVPFGSHYSRRRSTLDM